MLHAADFEALGPGLDVLPAPRRSWPAEWAFRARLAWHAPRLDQDLASGVSPDRDELHAARALQLLTARRRREIAEGLERVLRTSTRTPAFDSRIPLRRAAIRAEGEALFDLAARLLAPGPVSAQGVAIASLLVSEPDSPLHERAAPGAIEAFATTALRALEHLS